MGGQSLLGTRSVGLPREPGAVLLQPPSPFAPSFAQSGPRTEFATRGHSFVFWMGELRKKEAAGSPLLSDARRLYICALDITRTQIFVRRIEKRHAGCSGSSLAVEVGGKPRCALCAVCRCVGRGSLPSLRCAVCW